MGTIDADKLIERMKDDFCNGNGEFNLARAIKCVRAEEASAKATEETMIGFHKPPELTGKK